jgi:Polyketide cyclase / dehydrase and lipid transport
MTTPTGIDRDAPVIARHEIDIAAPLDTVWNLHTDVDAWPAWNLKVTAAKLDGAFAPGNSFTWTSYDFTVTSTIYLVEDHSRTLWGAMGRRRARHHGNPRMAVRAEPCRRPRDHHRIIRRRPGRRRPHRDANHPRQLADRLAHPPEAEG